MTDGSAKNPRKIPNLHIYTHISPGFCAKGPSAGNNRSFCIGCNGHPKSTRGRPQPWATSAIAHIIFCIDKSLDCFLFLETSISILCVSSDVLPQIVSALKYFMCTLCICQLRVCKAELEPETQGVGCRSITLTPIQFASIILTSERWLTLFLQRLGDFL